MTVKPNEMELLINLLQVDLEKRNVNDAQRDYLNMLIRAAADELSGKGITLNLEMYNDIHLVEMYAAYLYRKRALNDNGMPRMLQYALHCRLLEEHTKVI